MLEIVENWEIKWKTDTYHILEGSNLDKKLYFFQELGKNKIDILIYLNLSYFDNYR